jgi:repressor LexA
LINLTDKQRRVLEFLQKASTERALPPTVREICRATGIKSTSTVHLILKFLDESRYISRQSHASRAILLEGVTPPVQVPVLGTVTAGLPILAVETIDEYIPFSASAAHGRELFALRVRGDSMINAGIIDGDTVIAERCETAENGRIVVALIGDEATVKRLVKDGKNVYLAPENPAYHNIFSDELQLIGRVIASVRSYE